MSVQLSDWQAMESVNAVLEQYFRTQITSTEALNQIAHISGANKISHETAAGQQ
jgi:hypothetical protein